MKYMLVNTIPLQNTVDTLGKMFIYFFSTINSGDEWTIVGEKQGDSSIFYYAQRAGPLDEPYGKFHLFQKDDCSYLSIYHADISSLLSTLTASKIANQPMSSEADVWISPEEQLQIMNIQKEVVLKNLGEFTKIIEDIARMLKIHGDWSESNQNGDSSQSVTESDAETVHEQHSNSNKLGPNLRTELRFKVFSQLKSEHPEWSQGKLAMEVNKQKLLDEYVNGDTVRNTYRSMRVKWERGDRVR